MKLPKNKTNVYAVVRYGGSLLPVALIGVFANNEDADDFAGACKQEWIDKGLSDVDVSFRVELTTFYAS